MVCGWLDGRVLVLRDQDVPGSSLSGGTVVSLGKTLDPRSPFMPSIYM